MSRQLYTAPPPHATNHFITAEPIYETGPPVMQPRRLEPLSYSPRDNSDGQDVLNPFRNPQMTQTGPIPLVAPRPSYATNVSALTLNHPSPVATPVGRLPGDMYDHRPPAITVPQTPHPLQPPTTPIAPVFARPVKTTAVKFAPEQQIMRGEEEETLLLKGGQGGDRFWRRFSMVAKVENNKPSNWLAKTSSRQSRFSRWVLVLATFLVMSIVGVSVLGWYLSRKNPGDSPPIAVGGKESEKAIPTTTSSAVVGNLGGSTLFHVSPTLTVDKRGPSSTEAPNISSIRLSHQHKRVRRGATHLH